MTHVRPSSGTPDGFRAVRLAGTSATRPAVLDDKYGTGGGIGDERSAFRYTGAGDADLSLSGSAVEGPRTGTMEPRPSHIVFWIGDGSAVITGEDGVRSAVRPGQPFLLAASLRYEFEAATSRVSMLHLSDRLLRSALAADGVQVAGPLRFRRVESDTDLAPLRSALQTLGTAITAPEVEGRARAELNLRVARVVVATFPVDVPATTSSERLRDALTYIQEHAHGVVTLADIAAAAGMSPPRPPAVLQPLGRGLPARAPPERPAGRRARGAPVSGPVDRRGRRGRPGLGLRPPRPVLRRVPGTVRGSCRA
ncbi:hypothetical protein DEJ36_11065 [Curtobacterium sp. MCPF17_052]|nr:hypothetical protein [Curtobacterium sp. MCPF17_052]WIB11519.1 hypothetical protein DEJ36_11065 [Curtobacterium sp. MCPF17_052]